MADANSNPDTEEQTTITGPDSDDEGTGTTGQPTPETQDSSTDEQPEQTGSEDEEEVSTETTQEEKKEDTFFDPKTVPPELMPAWKQMQGAFTRSMQTLRAREQELVNKGATPTEAKEQAVAEAKAEQPDLVAETLTELGIDPKTVTEDQRRALDMMAKIALRASNAAAGKAVQPILAEKLNQQVQGWFDAHPDADKPEVRQAMANLDKKTGESLSMDELHYLATREATTKGQVKARSEQNVRKQQNNSERSSSSASVPRAPSSDPFSTMLEASAERGKRLP